MTKNISKKFDYSMKMTELERNIVRLQDTNTSIDEAIELHASSLRLVSELENYLQTAEVTIRKQIEKN